MSARKLSALLGYSADFSALKQAMERTLALQRLYSACAPPELTQHSRVVKADGSTLVLAADNGAVAAKLRQITPRLLKNLQKQAAQITVLQVRVQVGRPIPAHPSGVKNFLLPIDLIDDFERLSNKVSDPGLKAALSRFVANRRRRS